MKTDDFIHSILWGIGGIFTTVLFSKDCHFLLPVAIVMAALLYFGAQNTIDRDSRTKRIGAMMMIITLYFSGIFLFEFYHAYCTSSAIRLILKIVTIVFPAMSICDYIDIITSKKQESRITSPSVTVSDEDCKNEEDEEDEESEEYIDHDEEMQEVYSQLFEISKKCTNVKDKMIRAFRQKNELKEVELTIKRLEKIIYDKKQMKTIRPVYEKLVLYVEQNMRDILSICIAGRATQNKRLTKEELARIEAELQSSENKIREFENRLREVTSISIQKNDAFSDLDINAEFTAMENFARLRNNETDIFTPTPKTGT